MNGASTGGVLPQQQAPATVRQAAPATSSRVPSLDALRGIAAFVVVIHHSLLTSATLARPYRDRVFDPDGLFGALIYSPLHLPWAGNEAVMLFFVLSGYVLIIPIDRARRQGWAQYYAQRLVRLYLPIWASVAFTLFTVALVPMAAEHTSWWVNAHAGTATGENIVRSLTVVRGISFLDSPLWSMRWEVWFSLLLPLYLPFALVWRRGAVLKIPVLLALVVYGTYAGHQSLMYLPVFGIGCCLAAVREDLGRIFAKIGRAGFWVLLLAALAMMCAVWSSQSVNGVPTRRSIATGVMIAGAGLLVAVIACAPAAAVLGRSKVLVWLGGISFSLYLTHEPIIVAVANLHPEWNAGVVLVVVCVLALPAAVCFQALVERPAHQLSRWVGRRFSGRRERGSHAA